MVIVCCPFERLLIALNSNLTTKTGFVTKAQDSSAHQLTVKQFGNVVSVSGFVRELSLTANTAINIATISGVKMPQDTIRTVGLSGSNAYSLGTPCYIALATSGLITATVASASDTVVRFSFCYVANS